MRKNRKFDFFIKAAIIFLLPLCAGFNVAKAESLRGEFIGAREYSGEYSVEDDVNSDGMQVKKITIKLSVNGERGVLKYTYLADDFPSIKASDMGFLSVINNSGGMEGSVTYNYVIPDGGELVSIGTVQTTLHLGKVENIDVQPNENLTRNQINDLLAAIISFNPKAVSKPSNSYSAVTLLLLGQGKFLTKEDALRLSFLSRNKEIADDPVLLRALRNAIGTSDQQVDRAGALGERVIVSDRAYFFNYPKPSGIGQSYLIRGDFVRPVKASSDGKYWLSEYIARSGIKTKKWLHCEDINYCR